jgi:nucleotide-binding universal stress UspA family protein
VAERAIPVAAALAEQAGLHLSLITVLSEDDVDINATGYLKGLATQWTATPVTYEVLHGMPAVDPLVEHLRRHPGSLVCCSTHARADAPAFRLGSVAEELVRRSPVPVILVGPSADPPALRSRYDHVVVCVDAEPAHRLVSCVRDLTSTFGLDARLLEVIEPSYGAGRSDKGPRFELLEELSRQLAVDGMAAELDFLEDRNVPLAITTFAHRHQPALLALSSRRRYPEERYEETSVTVAIARLASCPVLVVGPAVEVERLDAAQHT